MARKLTFLVLVMAASVQAQDKPGTKPAAASPPAPKMTVEGKKFLEAWRGNWTSSDTTYTVGGEKMQGSMKMSCESVSSGWGTLCKGVMSIAPGAPPSQATFMMGWDIAAGEAHMFELGDTAEVHDHSGKWINDKSVSLVRQGKNLEGKIEKDSCTATWAIPSELKFDCVGTVAGATAWTFTSTSKK